MYANIQTEVCKCARGHATLQIIPALPHVSQMSPLARKKKKKISAPCLGFLARFVSTKTLNIHRLSSDLRWLPCQQIASHFGALGEEGGKGGGQRGRGGVAKNSFSIPHA